MPSSTIVVLSSVPKILFRANLDPKLQSVLFKMKPSTKRYSRLLILSSRIVFFNCVPKILFWTNFVPKFQSAFFRMKLGTKEYSGVLLLNLTIAFQIPFPE